MYTRTLRDKLASITLLTGPMGAGKTTLSNKLAPQYDVVHHSDVGYVDKKTGEYYIPKGPEKARAVKARLNEVLRDHRAGKRVLLDGYPNSMAKEYRRLLPQVSEVLYLDPGLLRSNYSVVKRSFQRGSSPIEDLKYALRHRNDTELAVQQIRSVVGKGKVRKIGRDYGLDKTAAEYLKAWHGSPTQLEEVRPSQARGSNPFQGQNAVYAADTPEHAALYAISKHLKGKANFAVMPDQVFIVGDAPLADGWVHELSGQGATKGHAVEDAGQLAIPSNSPLRPDKAWQVKASDYADKVQRVASKEDLRSRLLAYKDAMAAKLAKSIAS
jgi:adenylate kinase family enzyme